MIACVLIVFPVGAHAITLEPTATDVSVEPGAEAESELRLQNDSDRSRTYILEVVEVDLGAFDGLSTHALTEEQSSWLTLSESELTLAPFEEHTVTLFVNPPADAEPEMLSLAIQVIEQSDEAGGIPVQSGVLALVFVAIDSEGIDASYSARLESDSFFVSSLPVTVSLTIQNDGPRLVQPYGAIKIMSLLGREVETLEINPGGYRVLAGEQRTYQTSWGSGEGGIANFALGVFKIESDLSAWPEGPALEVDSSWVIVIPRYSVLAILVLLALAWLLVTHARRKRKTSK